MCGRSPTTGPAHRDRRRRPAPGGAGTPRRSAPGPARSLRSSRSARWPCGRGRSTTRPARRARRRRPGDGRGRRRRAGGRAATRRSPGRELLIGGVIDAERHQPIAEHDPVEVAVLEREAPIGPPLRRRSRPSGRRSSAGPSRAAPKRANPSRQTCSSSSSIPPKFVYTAIVDVPDLAPQPAGGHRRRALLGEDPGGGVEELPGDLGVAGAGHLTRLHHGVINNNVMDRVKDVAMTVEDSHPDAQVAARPVRPADRGAHGVRPAGRSGELPGRARRPLPAQRPEPGRPRRPGDVPLVHRRRHGPRDPPARRPGRVVPQPLGPLDGRQRGPR